MGAQERVVTRGRERALTLRRTLGAELRAARRQHGLSQEAAGATAGLSGTQVGRLERGAVGAPDLQAVAILAAAVGLELAVRVYPAGVPIRDAAHMALLGRFRSALHTSVGCRLEAPLPITGDLRAWDLLLRVGERAIGVELETRPTDLQALLRRIALKARDGGIDSVILVLGDTRHNRRLARLHADELAMTLPVPGRRAMELLAAGVHPGGSALVLR